MSRRAFITTGGFPDCKIISDVLSGCAASMLLTGNVCNRNRNTPQKPATARKLEHGMPPNPNLAPPPPPPPVADLSALQTVPTLNPKQACQISSFLQQEQPTSTSHGPKQTCDSILQHPCRTYAFIAYVLM